MNTISNDKVKKYIYYNVENYPSLGLLIQTVWGFSFVSSPAIALVSLGKAIPWSVAIVVLNLIYAIGVLVLYKRCNEFNSFSLRFCVSGVCAIIYSMYFLLYAYLILALENKTTISYVIILICYLLLVLLYNVFTIINIRKNKYTRNRNIKKNSSRIWIVIGAILGVNFMKMVRENADGSLESDIAIFCLCIVSFISVLGTTNWLKYYYCKKYSIVCDQYGNNTSILLTQYESKKKSTKSKKIASALPFILVIIFIIMLMLGLNKYR